MWLEVILVLLCTYLFPFLSNERWRTIFLPGFSTFLFIVEDDYLYLLFI